MNTSVSCLQAEEKLFTLKKFKDFHLKCNVTLKNIHYDFYFATRAFGRDLYTPIPLDSERNMDQASNATPFGDNFPFICISADVLLLLSYLKHEKYHTC